MSSDFNLHTFLANMVLGMTLNCLHRVIFLQHLDANDLKLLKGRKTTIHSRQSSDIIDIEEESYAFSLSQG